MSHCMKDFQHSHSLSIPELHLLLEAVEGVAGNLGINVARHLALHSLPAQLL